MNNRPFGQLPPMVGRGQSSPIISQQQQQMMMLQQQQFMARQQVIQREQLQRQRQLRQEEEKQAGIRAAIQDLQQKTLQQQFHQRPPHFPPQRPPLDHSHPCNQPRGIPPSLNRALAPSGPPYGHDSSLPGDPIRGPRPTNLAPPGSNLNGRFRQSPPVAPSPINHFTCPPPNMLPPTRLHVPPPLPINSSQPPPQFSHIHRPLLHTPGTTSVGSHNSSIPSTALLDTNSSSFIGRPPGFDTPINIMPPTSSCDRSISQRSQFGQFENTHNSPHSFTRGSAQENATIKQSRPPLLDIPGKSLYLGVAGVSTDKTQVKGQSPQIQQKTFQGSSLNRNEGEGGYRNRDSGYSSSRERGDISKVSRSLSREDRFNRHSNQNGSSRDKPDPRDGSRDKPDPRDGSRDKHDPRDGSRDKHDPRGGSRDKHDPRGGSRDKSDPRGGSRDKLDSRDGSRDKLDSRDGSRDKPYPRGDSRDKLDGRDGSRDKPDPKGTGQIGDGGSPHMIHTSRHPDSADRHRSDSRLTDEFRYSEDRRSLSGSYDRSRTSEHKSRHASSLGDRSPSHADSRDRNRSQGSSREQSLSTSRNSVSSTRSDRYSRSKTSSTRRASPSSSRNSSIGRRERTSKRSRSPVSSERSYSGQLSQYRQDLLKSEQKNEDESSLSPKRRKLDVDLDEDIDVNRDEELQSETDNISYFTRSCPADLYFSKNLDTGDMEALTRMVELENRFEEEIVRRAEKVRAAQIKAEEPAPVQAVQHHHHHCSGHKSSSCDTSSDGEDNDDDDDEDDGSCSQIMEEWDKRKKHPFSLHPELWFNLKGQANDGPLCRCSIKSRMAGIRHEIYPGERPIDLCADESSNLHQFHHYRITMSPYTNFLTKVPTLIVHDNHEYIFEGFSMFSHVKLENIPPCKLLRFNIEYTIHFLPESAPENFTVRSLNLFNRFIFTEILELVDVDWTGPSGGCQRFHFLPRFCRTLPDSGCKEVLSMNTVLSFLLKSVKPLVEESRLEEIMKCGENDWHSKVDNLRGMIVTNPGLRPSSIRVDQLDRKVTTPVVRTDIFDDNIDEVKKAAKSTKTDVEPGKADKEEVDNQPKYPLIIHQGYRPAQLSYAGDPVYRKAWTQYVKFRHLLNSKPKILSADKLRLKEQEEKLREIRMKKAMKREVTVELSSKGFLCTGLRADLCQHALMVPVLMSHLRFHVCLDVLEETLEYKFEDRNLLQLSLTHTSYRTNYGTNPDHTRNSLTNCGMRQVEYGDRRIHYQNTRKRGICILVDIMSRFGKQEETVSEIPHNERLEFLGDAVIEFLTSVHLFYMFPWLEEGGLTTYRMALVQNQHLAILAKKLKLQDFMLYVHGPDLCHESDLRHAMANCCEAIMGALFIDGGLDVVDKIFSKALFDDEDVLLHTWKDLPQHVLQQEEPGGDRHWVKSSPILQKMEKFEEQVGIRFNHIRILAKAFTHRNIGVNPLTLGHNQRLEFLGDTVLQLVASEYLYKHYPEHHEGHLSLLRSSLVNSRTQGLVYDDLGMSEFVICNENAVSEGVDMKTKQRADFLESFVGALFVDKDLDYCRSFCNVCFFPRLKDFIMNQDWNDPKSQLQQCCLTLREVGGGEPDIPVYKVIKSIGPTNTRKYVVAVYFRGKRLARGTGHSIQQAEMAAATQALKKRAELFPILQHQRRFLERMRKDDSEKDSDKDEVSSSYRMLKQPRTTQPRRPAVRSSRKK